MVEGEDLGIDGLSDFREIGRGGFAVVYSALQIDFDRLVAVKVLGALDDAGLRRFNRERRSMGRVDEHPNIVTPFSSGYTRPANRPYLLMEFLSGGSLQGRLDASGPFTVDEAVEVVLPIADALGHSHAAGLIHRDVKPANILVSGTGVVKLTDFGIAAIRESTVTSAVAYSLAYTPPETFGPAPSGSGDPRDERSDLYSLAATLYTLVAGRTPFDDEANNTPAGYMARIISQPPPSLGRPALDAFLGTALAKNPADRHDSAADFIEKLQTAISGPRFDPPAATATRPIRPISDLPPPAPVPIVASPPSRAPDPDPAPAVAADTSSMAGDSQPTMSRPTGRPHDQEASDLVPRPPLAPPPADRKPLTRLIDFTRLQPNRRAAVLAGIGGTALVLLIVALLSSSLFQGALDDGVGGGDVDTATGEEGTNEAAGSEEDSTSSVDPEEEAAGEDIREVAVTPDYGGTLVYGIEAEVSNPWAPYGLTCSISCAMPLGAISDPLFDIDLDGRLVPVLAEAITSNTDATVWTLTLRDGVLMHDGTSFDAGAVLYNINVCRASSGRGGDFERIDEIRAVNDLTVEFTLSAPWSAFPTAALDSPCGAHMMSPAWLRTLESNPLREESLFTGSALIDQATIETPATGDQAAPVSMGPFKFTSNIQNGGMTVERFDQYWRGGGPDSVTGEGLPYLDSIEFVAAPDIASRSDGLRSGEFDIIHTANSDEIVDFRNDGADLVRIEANRFSDTSFFLINQAVGDLDPDGLNATNPLIDVRVRRALAHAFDRERFAVERGAGIAQVANGPFSPGQPGHLEDNGYPEFDVTSARSLMTEYISDPGRSDGRTVGDPITVTLGNTSDPFNIESTQLVASMWTDTFEGDIEVQIEPIDASDYVARAVNGDYQVFGWRQHGGNDHDTQLRFWASSTAAPIGTPTFNFGRFSDPELDALADASRSTTNQSERAAIFEDMNRRFGDQVYYLPTIWTTWGIIANANVMDIAQLSLPDGGQSFPVINGVHPVTQIWCANGAC